MKLKFCLIVGLLLLTSSYTKADELISIYLNNSDHSPVRIEVSTISTIKFKTTKLVVTNHDNISNDFYFSDVIKIAFNEEGTSITTPNASTASISPNPVKDNLMIQDAEKMYGSDICIYSVTGTLVSKHSQWNGESIDVSHLSPGIYFVNTNSTTLKFVKK
ncbi:MAG: T9SS type A sorting domain-containing protein [Bacteroidales bacterium]|nr:T9SS type A sorting domain-containing protein [Bacteroidales bacterium]